MIDDALHGKLFVSVNMIRRRDLFDGYSKLGFLHCSIIEEIIQIIEDLEISPEKNSHAS